MVRGTFETDTKDETDAAVDEHWQEPRRLMTPIPKLTTTGDPTYRPTAEAFSSTEEALGIALPPSYRAFTTEYGFGLTLGLFIIYAPVAASETRKSENVVSSARTLARENREAIAHRFLRNYAPDGYEEIVRRLVPFGYSENGDRILWDPADKNEEGALAVYVIGSGYSPVRRAGQDLGEFLTRALQPGIGGLLGNATFTLRPTFEPWPVFVE